MLTSEDVPCCFHVELAAICNLCPGAFQTPCQSVVDQSVPERPRLSESLRLVQGVLDRPRAFWIVLERAIPSQNFHGIQERSRGSQRVLECPRVFQARSCPSYLERSLGTLKTCSRHGSHVRSGSPKFIRWVRFSLR